MDQSTEHGYLVLADISGYTSYLARVELEHAHQILTDLLEIIVSRFKDVLTISKLEGDAVFANINETALPIGERLLELIENTYLAFRQRRDSVERQTTCTCQACKNIPSLDLKFFIHHGDYIVQNIFGIRELVGSDVNLIHRLTKNHITEETGWRAYILFTQNAIKHIQVDTGELHHQVESYDFLGEVEVLSMNLHERYANIINARRVTIEAREADHHLEYVFNRSLIETWNWLLDLDHRSRAMGESGHWTNEFRPGGRSSAGARNHCAHGKGASTETILDWRPFEYATSQNVDNKNEYLIMFLFFSMDEGQRTRVEVRMKLINPQPLWLTRLMIKALFRLKDPYLGWFRAIDQLILAG